MINFEENRNGIVTLITSCGKDRVTRKNIINSFLKMIYNDPEFDTTWVYSQVDGYEDPQCTNIKHFKHRLFGLSKNVNNGIIKCGDALIIFLSEVPDAMDMRDFIVNVVCEARGNGVKILMVMPHDYQIGTHEYMGSVVYVDLFMNINNNELNIIKNRRGIVSNNTSSIELGERVLKDLYDICISGNRKNDYFYPESNESVEWKLNI